MECNVTSLVKGYKLHFKVHYKFRTLAVALGTVFGLALFTAQIAQAQQFHTLYHFTGGNDGGAPWAGVTVAGSGVLYGTTSVGGPVGAGTVFSLKNHGFGWTLDPIYGFTAAHDGVTPYAGVVFGPNGALYGTTFVGGGSDSDGTVFELQPSANFCRTVLCTWNEAFLFRFQTGMNGDNPLTGNVIFDHAGNLYGTTSKGGNEIGGEGTVYQVTPSGGINVLYNFCCVNNGTDGYYPFAGVIFDPAGDLYGTTFYGGNEGCGGEGCGTVFELTPSGGGTWTESIIHRFDGFTGSNPEGTLIRDSSGNLYGTTYGGGTNNDGVVFMLSYSGGWVYTPLYTLPACSLIAGVTMDAAGNLYGVCASGGASGFGFVFKLSNSSGTWSLADLHDFARGDSDGYDPLGDVAFDSSGNLFGTTSSGAIENCLFGCGTVWEITGLRDRR